MRVDWRSLRGRHPRFFMLMVATKRVRTKVGLAAVAICIAKGIHLNEPPFDLDEPNVWVALGLLLILAGVGFRVAAHGCLKKKESLATSGVYSLCRHPLYLGSMLIAYGFCCLLDDPENFIVANVYFLVFYSLAIVWEETRLAERYEVEHSRYAQTTPLLLPFGRFRPNEFAWTRAVRKGGGVLIGMTCVLLAAVEVMAEIMR